MSEEKQEQTVILEPGEVRITLRWRQPLLAGQNARMEVHADPQATDLEGLWHRLDMLRAAENALLVQIRETAKAKSQPTPKLNIGVPHARH